LLAEGTKNIPLTQKAFRTLLALVESRGQIVSKEELLQRVWPNTYVGEATLAQNVSTLRKQLKDDRATAHYIETVPKRGYRFVATVTEIVPKMLGSEPESRPGGTPPRQEIRFCLTRDGVRIAWASVGSGYPLVKAAMA
jgi:DNA-binding winged helix-turn-helix (wHTH) protein